MKVALVHDWVNGLRGGERVLDELAGLYPAADLYTLFYVPGSTTERIDQLRVHTSVLARLPRSGRYYRVLLPFFPWAIERFRLTGYDLVISTSHAVAKGVRVPRGTAHLCYCFTPMRYIWDQSDAYLGRGFRRALAAPLVSYLRGFDTRTSTPERVTRFAAVSRTVAARIQRRYGRSANVVYPPVDVDRIRPNGQSPSDFFLLVAAFVPYKREEIAIEAFRRLGHRLIVAGDGPARRRLAARSPTNVEFVGRVSDAALADLYARCRALVFPSEEDFGIVPVEAQAAGRPVIAFSSGGASESVVNWDSAAANPQSATGIGFEHQTPEALAEAVRRFTAVEEQFDARTMRANAERFDVPHFRAAIQREVESTLNDSFSRASSPEP